ncbi:MAG: AAA family ATPase [Oscillospiraceae bacterium]
MKLLRMTATFGRLDHETLTLTDGLNLLQLPNEAGKSTWAEFLLAMFYGIDTSEREKTGVLPVKAKYQPWNGKAMEGTIELEQDGRRITLTRTSAARAPMSVFSAVYTDSGLPVEGLTGANCGERLLGVPKSVYQRSAFVRQAGLGLTPDESLESRLSALVTTGDETVSYAAADKRLQAWQNRVKHNKTGLIPDAERALAAVEENLQTLAGEHQKNLELHAQLQQLQQQKTNCEAQLRALEAAETQQKRKRLYDAKLAALQASNRENAAAAQCARLPQEGTLQTLSQDRGPAAIPGAGKTGPRARKARLPAGLRRGGRGTAHGKGAARHAGI